MDLTKSELVKPNTGQGIVLFVRRLLARQEAAILIPLVALTLFFYLRNPNMLAPITVTSILRTMAFPGLIGMGMVVLMITGEIDLSTASVMSLTAVLAPMSSEGHSRWSRYSTTIAKALPERTSDCKSAARVRKGGLCGQFQDSVRRSPPRVALSCREGQAF